MSSESEKVQRSGSRVRAVRAIVITERFDLAPRRRRQSRSASFRVVSLGIFALCFGASVACATNGSTASRTTAPDAGTVTDESVGRTVSVRPGVNDRYESVDALDTYTEIFEGERREVVAHRAGIVDALGLQPGMTVADIGAGTGLFTFELAAKVGPNGRVLAVDTSPTFLAALRSKVSEKGVGNVIVHRAQPRDVELEPRSLDVALMSNVYHHVEYPFAYMPTVANALADDGELLLIDFERIEGTTSKAMLAHVRVGKDTVIEELERSGLVLVEEVSLGLSENYALRLRVAR